ncbi:MAG TPA: hypothetical protein VN937_10960 [Blastocatellia bacterium]|nr:hypothetical protein [Blastocatellia bacterium]
MKRKTTEEFDTFDAAMRGLLAVPHKELQQKLDEEKRAKAASPRRSRKAKRDDVRKH